MEQIDGKEKILKIALDLIMKNGYNSVSIRNIVSEANISIGTLYYHFPLGKLSILSEIFQSTGEKFFQDHDFPAIMQSIISPDVKENHLHTVLEAIRQIAPIIKGFEVELLTNKNMLTDAKNLMTSNQDKTKKVMSDFISKFMPEFIGHEKSVSVFNQIIISTMYLHVILDGIFGTDDELMEVMTKMIRGFLSIKN